MTSWLRSLRPAISLVIIFTLLVGVVYPLLVTGASQLLFAKRADGSLIRVGDKVIGSKLLGQHFSQPHYFWGRPSSTTPPYNAAASSGSNLGMANPVLHEQIAARIAELKRHDPASSKLIPVDLITASASGLDPHISLEAALYQLPRVAKLRGMSREELGALIKLHERRGFQVMFGAPYVHVLELNRELDAVRPMSAVSPATKKQVKSPH